MDPLFWILAGVVVGCVIGIIIIWRLEIQAEHRAADTRKVEEEISARLKHFDLRAAVEGIDTGPIPVAQPDSRSAAPRQQPGARPGPAEQRALPNGQPDRFAAASMADGAVALPSMQLHPETAPAAEAGPGALANGKTQHPGPAEALPTTPELARLRAAELGRERRYLEQMIEEQQARLAYLLQGDAPDGPEDPAVISQVQSELAQQRQRLEEISFLEERYRRAAIPSLEQLTQHYKKAASPHMPKAFGVRRHSLARIQPPGKNPPAPPAQAATDSSS
jgi:uncharacterized membrane-anchored protein YhcB (DUF1043 family)